MAKATSTVEVPKEELTPETPKTEKPVEVPKEVKTTEQLIAEFAGKQKGEYSINDLLKTVPQVHDTVTHLKQLGSIITKLKLKVKDNAHLQLGKNYYEVDTAKQLHYGLDDIDLVVEK